MYRIAHVSDLHLVAPGVTAEHTTLQKLAAALGASAGLKIEANPYSTQRLNALKLAMRELQPSALFITGDLTNYGDAKSFQFAKDVIKELRREGGNPVTLVVPGNHDTLTERAAALEKDTSFRASLVRKFSRLSPELTLARKLARTRKKKFPEGGPAFLMEFTKTIASAYAPVDPSAPVFLDMRWGKAAVFLFNSNVDDAFMANAGCIGDHGYDQLHRGLSSPDLQLKLKGTIRIALLHHHPISAPQALDPAVERFYNWMEDGPLLLQYLNTQKFSLIMHGHQHEPFVCTVNYRREDDRPLHIIAAGSATQAGGRASFNVVDFLSPFEVRVQRHDYENPQFVPDERHRCRLPVRQSSSIRLTQPSAPELPEDGALRNLIQASDASYDADIQYQLLDYTVEITPQQLYKADYRRVGTVLGAGGVDGTTYVLTGSPATKLTDMKITATSKGDPANYDVIADYGTRKVLRVSPKGVALKINDTFDVSLHFEWQASPEEPNDFDGFNFMSMRHDVGRFQYSVTFPWHAARISVTEYVLEETDAECDPLKETKTAGPNATNLTIHFPHPRPVVYLIYFGETLPRWK